MPQKKTLEKYAQKPGNIPRERTPEEQERGRQAWAQLLGMAAAVGVTPSSLPTACRRTIMPALNGHDSDVNRSDGLQRTKHANHDRGDV